MNRIYYVVIKGRTLESRNLKELLARAVSAKRDSDRGFSYQARFHEQLNIGNASKVFIGASPGVGV